MSDIRWNTSVDIPTSSRLAAVAVGYACALLLACWARRTSLFQSTTRSTEAESRRSSKRLRLHSSLRSARHVTTRSTRR